jgi:hypothetical protein
MNSKKLFKLTAIAAVTAGLAGTAQAEANRPATLDEEVNRQTDVEELSACHDAVDAGTTALSPEAPWVSLALSNAERIELSAGQVRQLEILRADFEEEAKSRLQTIGEAELDLRRTLSGAPVDLQQVSARLDRIAELRATYRLRRIETLLTGRDVLSIAQQEQLQDVVTQATTAMHRAMMDGIQEQEPAGRSGGRM